MSGPNHITGGIVFTGIFASLWDINIFSDLNLILITWFASLLPDIDHTKSIIGKFFYPIAKYLDRNFGHRTITHSLTFYIPSVILVSLISNSDYTIVFALALFSHFLFDMVTVQGIPLFYPFKRNSCVIPASPDARMRSGNIRTELVAFAIFIFAGVSCYPLMVNGFWLSFNRGLGSTKQMVSEFKRSDNILTVDYEFRRDFFHFKGTGYCLSASEALVILYDSAKSEFIKITANDVVKTFQPLKSKFTRLEQISTTQTFSNLSPNGLNSLIKGKPLLSLSLFASKPININLNGKLISVQTSVQNNYINKIEIINTTNKITSNQAQIKEIELNQIQSNYTKQINEFNHISANILQLKIEYKKANDFRKSQINKSLKKLNPTKINHQKFRSQIKKKQLEINQLKKDKPNPVKLYGTIQFVQL